MNTTIRTYTKMVRLKTFEERFEYLRLDGVVGSDTFGFDRYLNQIFYKSREWKSLRDKVIIRDNGCDLGIEGKEISGRILIHHLNPISKNDITDKTRYLIDPEFLVCVSHATHNAIHYGDSSLLPKEPAVRTRYDTCPWKK